MVKDKQLNVGVHICRFKKKVKLLEAFEDETKITVYIFVDKSAVPCVTIVYNSYRFNYVKSAVVPYNVEMFAVLKYNL